MYKQYIGNRLNISHRLASYLENVVLVQRDMENSYLNLPVDDEDSRLHLQGASVSYRIAMGPQQGQKVFTLQTLPASTEGEYGQLANTSGFSLHAGVFANADEPEKLDSTRLQLWGLDNKQNKILRNRFFYGRAACVQILILLYQRLENTKQ